MLARYAVRDLCQRGLVRSANRGPPGFLPYGVAGAHLVRHRTEAAIAFNADAPLLPRSAGVRILVATHVDTG